MIPRCCLMHLIVLCHPQVGPDDQKETKLRVTLEMAGAPPQQDLWCARNLQVALDERPNGIYRHIIYQWVLRRTQSKDTASHAVKLTLLWHLKQTDLDGRGDWRPDRDSPYNSCTRWAYYSAVATLLGWTERRGVLSKDDGDGTEANGDGYSFLFHMAVFGMWPGKECHDPSIPIKVNESEEDLCDRIYKIYDTN
jgi:hypothetical protein